MAAPNVGWQFGAWPPGLGGGEGSEVAFGVDWPPDSDAPDEHGRSVAPSAVTTQDVDLSAVPANSCAVIRFTVVWFQLTGVGVVNMYYDAVVLALRDENGDLHSNVSSWAGPAVAAGGTIPPTCFQLTDITTPDNDTVRIELTNLQAESAIVFWRFIVSTVAAGNPIPPPPP